MSGSASGGARLQSTWLSLSPNTRGVVWIAVGAVFFSLNDSVVKHIGTDIHPVEMAWFRYVIGLLLLSPIFIRLGWSGLRTERLALHAGRAFVAGIGQAGVYYSVVHLMLADATALSFTRPLFMTILAVFVLGEVVGWRRWAATGVGFVGVLIMIRPGQGTVESAAIVAIVAAFLFSIGLIIVRRLARTDSPTQILFYYHAFGALLFTLPAIWMWETPAGSEWLLLAMVGVLTCTAMVCFIRGFAIGEASILGPMEYIRLVYAAALGFLLFAEVPDYWTWIGAAIIMASTLYIARREAAGAPPARAST